MQASKQGIEWVGPAFGTVAAEPDESLATFEHYGVLTASEAMRNGSALVTPFTPSATGGFVKVPAEMVSRLIDGRVSMVELSDWIICGAIMRMIETRTVSPTMTQLCEMTGTGWRHVAATTERLENAGIIARRKVPYSYGGGEYSAKWVFSIPQDSPAAGLLMDSKGPADWRAVPLTVAQDRSITAVAVYLVLAEQMRTDKCITTTPADLARSLHTTSRTARRILEKCGAREVARRGRTRVYVMPGMFDRPQRGPVAAGAKLDDISAGVRGGEATIRLEARLQALRQALRRHRCDSAALESRAIAAVAAAGITPTRATVVRTLESLHLRVVMNDPNLAGAVARSVAGRVKGLKRSERRRAVGVLASAAVQRVADRGFACPECDGEGIIEVSPDAYAACHCTRGG